MNVYYKAVRSNGTSLYARGRLMHKYDDGKVHTFPSHLQAHVYKDGDEIDELRMLHGNRRILLVEGNNEKQTSTVAFVVNGEVWEDEVRLPGLSRSVTTINSVRMIGEVFLPNPKQWSNRIYDWLSKRVWCQ